MLGFSFEEMALKRAKWKKWIHVSTTNIEIRALFKAWIFIFFASIVS